MKTRIILDLARVAVVAALALGLVAGAPDARAQQPETPAQAAAREAAAIERQAERIDRRLMAPCCGTNTLDQHDSGVSRRMRGQIRDMLREGKSEDEILAVFVEEFGNSVLAVPDAEGFALIGYLAPLWMSLLGMGLLGYAVWRWRKGRPEGEVVLDDDRTHAPFRDAEAPAPAPAAAAAAAGSTIADYERRVAEQLRALDD